MIRVGPGLEFETVEDAFRSVKGKVLIIELDYNVFGEMRPIMRLSTPGKTPRSRPVDLLGAYLVAQDGETHSDQLRSLADILEMI